MVYNLTCLSITFSIDSRLVINKTPLIFFFFVNYKLYIYVSAYLPHLFFEDFAQLFQS